MISKILDMMEKLVQSKKEEEPMSGSGSIFGVPLTGINSNTNTVTTTVYPTASYPAASLSAQGLQQLYSTGNTTNSYITGIGGGGGNAVYTTYGIQSNASYYTALPPMSGVLHTLPFTDCNGVTMAITVDAAYVQILADISRAHQNTYGQPARSSGASPFAGQPHLKMLEGDFSEEEMTEAEGIIAELEGKGGEASPPSRP